MNYIAALLTWFAAEPQAIDNETPKCSAAVCFAYSSMVKADAEQDRNPAAGLDEVGAGWTPTEATEGRQQQTNSSSSRVLQQTAPGMATRCTDGRCVPVQAMPKSYYRTKTSTRRPH